MGQFSDVIYNGADFKFRVAMEAAKGQKTLNELASEHGVELPIADAVNALIEERMNPQEMVTALISRSAKPESA